jgi:fumarate reductase subunit C
MQKNQENKKKTITCWFACKNDEKATSDHLDYLEESIIVFINLENRRLSALAFHINCYILNSKSVHNSKD